MTRIKPQPNRHKVRELSDRPAADRRPVLSLIVPTRNEAANVRELLGRIDGAVGEIATEIIFVDDSDDGTPEVVSRVSQDYRSSVSLVHRPPQERDGLGGAVTKGIGLAQGEWVCVMDADLQHPPELVSRLLATAERERCDIVVASRYVRGGSARGLGSPLRKGISVASAWLSRLLFVERLRSVTDPCAGFFLVRSDLVADVELKPVGFKILLEVLMRTPWRRLEEVPYEFEGRSGGESKATLAQGRAFLKHLLKLWLEVPGAGRFWKFAAVGATGVIVNLAVLWMLAIGLGWSRWAAWAIALEGSILWNFFFNRGFTWADRSSVNMATPWRGDLTRGIASYHAVAGTALIANASVFTSLSVFGSSHVMLAGAVAILASMLINFVGADRLVFRLRPLRERRGELDARLEEVAD